MSVIGLNFKVLKGVMENLVETYVSLKLVEAFEKLLVCAFICFKNGIRSLTKAFQLKQ